MNNTSYFYFEIQLEVRTAACIVKSETDFFPMKKVSLFAEEYNQRDLKRGAKRHEIKFRDSITMKTPPHFYIEKIVRISEEDFIFLSNEKDFYFVIE